MYLTADHATFNQVLLIYLLILRTWVEALRTYVAADGYFCL